jgi:hypothetical protein
MYLELLPTCCAAASWTRPTCMCCCYMCFTPMYMHLLPVTLSLPVYVVVLFLNVCAGTTYGMV